jgi:hypothetical protein
MTYVAMCGAMLLAVFILANANDPQGIRSIGQPHPKQSNSYLLR